MGQLDFIIRIDERLIEANEDPLARYQGRTYRMAGAKGGERGPRTTSLGITPEVPSEPPTFEKPEGFEGHGPREYELTGPGAQELERELHGKAGLAGKVGPGGKPVEISRAGLEIEPSKRHYIPPITGWDISYDKFIPSPPEIVRTGKFFPKIESDKICTTCEGAGYFVDLFIYCPYCAGEGKREAVCHLCQGVARKDCLACAGAGKEEVTCHQCEGSGKMTGKAPRRTCKICHGVGVTNPRLDAYYKSLVRRGLNPKITPARGVSKYWDPTEPKPEPKPRKIRLPLTPEQERQKKIERSAKDKARREAVKARFAAFEQGRAAKAQPVAMPSPEVPPEVPPSGTPPSGTP